ncbi:MAG: hypothetical protein Q9188_007535 [Gyalolechia gomerana]
MAPSENTVIAFDLYGTLLSTESVAKELAKHFGEERAATVAATWRKYQLERIHPLLNNHRTLSPPRPL